LAEASALRKFATASVMILSDFVLAKKTNEIE
jgi:hypothetical protein